MGCGCGGGRSRSNVRQVRNVVVPTGVVAAANIQPNSSEKILQERRILETKRREKLLRALKVP